MLERGDSIARGVTPIVTWVIEWIHKMRDPRTQLCSYVAHAIGSYQSGVYIYPEIIEINVTTGYALTPHGSVLSILASHLEKDPKVSNCRMISLRDSFGEHPLHLDFSLLSNLHFRIHINNTTQLRTAVFAKQCHLAWPLCRFATFTLRHVVLLFSVRCGLNKEFIDSHTVSTLTIIHHHLYTSVNPRQLQVLEAPKYIESLVLFIRNLQPRRLYSLTTNGRLLVAAPPIQSQILHLDNPCLVHPLCPTRDLLRDTLYFRSFQWWLSYDYFLWVCSQK